MLLNKILLLKISELRVLNKIFMISVQDLSEIGIYRMSTQ
jgi:hypothetical protein